MEHNPQAEQMSDESMLRNLAAQAEAIWPQEANLLSRYPRPENILDVGCGSGEIAARLLERFPRARLRGVDLDDNHLKLARERCNPERALFTVGDALSLDLESDSFDLTVCRHLAQAVPTPDLLVEELIRVTRPGGIVHIVAEDYGLMKFYPTEKDADQFWHEAVMEYGRKTGTDLRIGRRMPTIALAAGLRDVRCDYLVIDTLRVERETFARIWTAWQDGYAAAITANSPWSRQQVEDCFRDMLRCIRDPAGYAVWLLPVISGAVP